MSRGWSGSNWNSSVFRVAASLLFCSYHIAMATRFSGIRYAPVDSEYFLDDGSHLADESVVAVVFYNGAEKVRTKIICIGQ